MSAQKAASSIDSSPAGVVEDYRFFLSYLEALQGSSSGDRFQDTLKSWVESAKYAVIYLRLLSRNLKVMSNESRSMGTTSGGVVPSKFY
jgi:hypothetical protein